LRQIPSKAARVLVVDDDEGLLILMTESLRSAGHQVTAVSSGNAAWNALEEKGTDLLLLDLKMKDMAGQALLQRLREARSPVPFIVVTGQGDEKIAVEVMKHGALDYVRKDSGLLDLLPTLVTRALATVAERRALASSRLERRKLENELLQIGERERRRIGSDLHDGLGQQLTALELFCSTMKSEVERDQPALAERLSRMGAMLREAVAQTRSLAQGLVPVSDDPAALRAGLLKLADRAASVGLLRCRLEAPPGIELTNPAAAGHLYRIAQEALNNAMKHSQASEVVLRLAREKAGIRLEIADNGKGLAKTARKGGLGLEVMKHRAALMGGVLRVTSRPGRGVTVVSIVPDTP